MATPTLVRGSNPVWSFVDLQGNQFDDTFYMFVLENDLPYSPATVWQDPFGNVPWTNPIQFLANGTLPIDIYFDPTMVYRLEFRQGPTQADPLIYLVQNYSPNGSGSGPNPPVDEITVTTGNQITNPQFSLVNFASPFSVTATFSNPINVAPGWDLVLIGTGTVTLEQVALNSDDINPTNAPYALHITISGTFSSLPYLRQIFNQSGMLWANNSTTVPQLYVSGSITSKVETTPITISSGIVDSQNTPLATIIEPVPLSDTFEEYTGYNNLPLTTNTDVPPDASIEYRIFLQGNCDVYITSVQLVTSNQPLEYTYEQETIERQVDHTFHYYRESILFQPKNSILTGWDFALNPWQFTSTNSPPSTNLANNAYTADQTIVVQQAYVASATDTNNIKVGQGSAAQGFGLLVTSVTATNQFALIQYIDPSICAPYWGETLSALVKLVTQKQGPTSNLRVKMKLIRSTGLPTTTNQTYPISSWTALGEPAFNGAWTVVSAINDPVYNLVAGQNIISFNGFNLAAASTDTETLAIVFYTLDQMDSSGTADYIDFNSISLVPNDFAIETNPKTFTQTLSDCEFYYQDSYNPFILPGTASATAGQIAISLPFDITGSSFNIINIYPGAFGLQFRNEMRANPTIQFYSPTTGNGNTVDAYIYNNGSAQGGSPVPAAVTTYWNVSTGQKSYSTVPKSGVILQTTTTINRPSGNIVYHFTADARLGV
jgi:hypothetical protein